MLIECYVVTSTTHKTAPLTSTTLKPHPRVSILLILTWISLILSQPGKAWTGRHQLLCWCVHVHVYVSLVYNTSISCIYVYMSDCVNEYECGYMCMHFIKITLTFICRIQYTAQFLIQYNFNNYHEVILKHSHIISLY